MNGAYIIKWTGETLRLVAIAVVVYAATIIGEGVDNVDDWQAWAKALGFGAIPIATAVLSAQWAKLHTRFRGSP